MQRGTLSIVCSIAVKCESTLKCEHVGRCIGLIKHQKERTKEDYDWAQQEAGESGVCICDALIDETAGEQESETDETRHDS